MTSHAVSTTTTERFPAIGRQRRARRGRIAAIVLMVAVAAGGLTLAPAADASQTVRVTAITHSNDATGLSGGFVTVRATFADANSCFDIISVERGYQPGGGGINLSQGADVTVDMASVACGGRYSNRLRFRVPHPIATDVLNVTFRAEGRVVAAQRAQITNQPRFTFDD